VSVAAKLVSAKAGGWVFQHRRWCLMVVDVACWGVGLFAAAVLRFNLGLDRALTGGLGVVILVALVAQAALGSCLGLYHRRRWRYGSFDEMGGVATSAVLTTALLLVSDLAAGSPHLVPLGAVIGGGAISLVAMGSTRYVVRLAYELARRPGEAGTIPLLVFGAGEGGAQIVASLQRDPASPYVPVGLLDDDPAKRNLRIMGVRVLGSRAELGRVARERRAHTLLIAIPSADAALISELNDLATHLDLEVKVLPPVGEILGARVSAGDIRSVTMEDLIGRRPVDIDLDSIAGYLTGRRVLVTGAGGSIGSELCRQITRFAPGELLMLDRDESALHALQLSLEGRALLDSSALILADLRDRAALWRVFAEHRPEVVFHAAALKHLTMLERHPAEAWKTNVLGTIHVLEAAADHGVTRFVNISTDKAADPSSVLGYSKRIAERLTAEVAKHALGTYLSVRFGNVWASRGSVVETFKAQLAAGGPLTVTDPKATRYFMTISEAVQLTIQAGGIGRSGEALVLDMGAPVSIDRLARKLAASASRPVRVVYTGLRPGEKRHEQLLGSGEVDRRPVHPLISHVDVPPLNPAHLLDLDVGDALPSVLRAICHQQPVDDMFLRQP
jgi:FlaA1/EpsC-like NDP-sugar epimerase